MIKLSIRKCIVMPMTLLMLLSLTVTSCSKTTTTQSEVIIAQSEVQRATSPDVEEGSLTELTIGNNGFAFDLYQVIQREEGNLFYSPYSISTALAMTYAGARNNTERQMAETLHYTLPQDQLHPTINALDLGFTDLGPDTEEESFKLAVANSLWGQVGYSFRSEFLDVIAENYGAELRLVDFIGEDEREQSRLAINNWVSEETEGKIEELFSKDIFNQYTRLVLANAIYFKAEWETPFLNGTQDDTFTLLDGSKVTVPMMSRRASTGYAEGPGYQVVEIPYKGGRMQMVILLPVQGQFETFEHSLDSERVDQILQMPKPSDVKLFMPKFGYETSLSLAETLAEMGMPDAFDPERADFSGMDGTTWLFIAHVIHKAFVAVDEIGTEAAAATGVVAEIESMPITVRVDRPFIFLIRDVESGVIVFIGRVTNPTA